LIKGRETKEQLKSCGIREVEDILVSVRQAVLGVFSGTLKE